MPAVFSATVISLSVAPRFISTQSVVGCKCSTFARLRFMPVTSLGPVISAKFLSTTSTITHFFPASRPTTLTQIFPTSIAGNLNPRHFD
jgi:hypothetical protein